MKCPACKTVDLVAAKRNSFHMDFCPECRGIWLERMEIDRILLRLKEAEIAAQELRPADGKLTDKKEKSPILDSIYASKELHHLQHLQGKQNHWLHRLFD